MSEVTLPSQRGDTPRGAARERAALSEQDGCVADQIDLDPDADGNDATGGHKRLRRTGRTAEERKSKRRAALLDAALELFGTQGYPSTTVEQICKAAAVSTRDFYEEFANREAVLGVLYDNTIARLTELIQSVEVGTTTGYWRDLSHAQVEVFIHGLVDDPRVARVALLEVLGVSQEMELRRRRVHQAFAEFIMVQGASYAATLDLDRDYRKFAIGIVGATNEIMIDWLLADEPESVDLLIAGIFQIFDVYAADVIGDEG